MITSLLLLPPPSIPLRSATRDRQQGRRAQTCPEGTANSRSTPNGSWRVLPDELGSKSMVLRVSGGCGARSSQLSALVFPGGGKGVEGRSRVKCTKGKGKDSAKGDKNTIYYSGITRQWDEIMGGGEI